MCLSETELLYLCSAIIQSLAALLGITLVAYGFSSEKGKRLKIELFKLAQIYWERANMMPEDYARGWRPDVSRHTTEETAPEWLRKQLKHIEEHYEDIGIAAKKKLEEFDKHKVIRPNLFSWSLVFGFLGLLIATIVLVFASEIGNTDLGSAAALVVILTFFIAIILFIKIIASILGLETGVVNAIIPSQFVIKRP